MYIPDVEVPESPFAFLRSAELNEICSSSGFQILRSYLATALSSEFCSEHAYDSPEMHLAWLLQRDILHAMTMPVVELYKEAAALAAAALGSQTFTELEVAFKGEARFAFLWLQCLISEEEDWCHTRGCPACNVLQTLSTELTIRGAITSALLSSKDVPIPDTPTSETGSDADTESHHQPTLPDFSVILPALSQATDNDSFWGPGHYALILARSQRIVAGIQALMSQCEMLESLVSSAPPSPSDAPGLRRIDILAEEGSKEIRIKRGAVARRQVKLRDEQGAMMMRMALQTWSAVHLDRRQRERLKAGASKRPALGHKRTFTT